MTNPPLIRLPLTRLAVAQLVAAVAIVCLGGGLGMPFSPGVLPAVLPALSAVIVGIVAGVAFLGIFPPREATDLPMRVLFAGTVRMFVALAMALWCWFAFGPEKIPFWLLFLAGALAALVAEVVAVLPVLRGVAAPASASPKEEAA